MDLSSKTEYNCQTTKMLVRPAKSWIQIQKTVFESRNQTYSWFCVLKISRISLSPTLYLSLKKKNTTGPPPSFLYDFVPLSHSPMHSFPHPLLPFFFLYSNQQTQTQTPPHPYYKVHIVELLDPSTMASLATTVPPPLSTPIPLWLSSPPSPKKKKKTLKFPLYPENPLIQQCDAEYWIMGDLMTYDIMRSAGLIRQASFRSRPRQQCICPFPYHNSQPTTQQPNRNPKPIANCGERKHSGVWEIVFPISNKNIEVNIIGENTNENSTLVMRTNRNYTWFWFPKFFALGFSLVCSCYLSLSHLKLWFNKKTKAIPLWFFRIVVIINLFFGLLGLLDEEMMCYHDTTVVNLLMGEELDISWERERERCGEFWEQN